MTPEELRAFVRVMREEGVATLRVGDAVISLAPAPPAGKPEPIAPAARRKEYEKILFACTEGIPDDE